MNVTEASNTTEFVALIKSRRSSRAFRSQSVPRAVLQQVLEAAVNAPSWGNTQPWRFTVVGGQRMLALKEALRAKAASGEAPAPDLPFPSYSGEYRRRYSANGARMYAALGIERDDRERRELFTKQMIRYLDAPNGIVVHMDKDFGPYSMLDVGLALQNLFLAAHALGLGTCPLAYGAIYPDTLREVLGIPPSQAIICGVAIGYPDRESPACTFRSEREPLEATVTLVDLD